MTVGSRAEGGVNPNFENIGFGRVDPGSKELTLKDVIEYKSNTTWIGKVVSKLILKIQDKGSVNTASIERIVNSLGEARLKELVRDLDQYKGGKKMAGLNQTWAMLNEALSKANQAAVKQYEEAIAKPQDQLTSEERNVANRVIMEKLARGEELTDQEAASFMNTSSLEPKIDQGHLESFMEHLAGLREELRGDESPEALEQFQEIESILNGDNKAKLAELVRAYADSLVSESELGEPNLDQMFKELQGEAAARVKAEAEANKPSREVAMQNLVNSMNDSVVNMGRLSWDERGTLDKNLAALSDLDQFAEITDRGTDPLDTFKLQEELGRNNYNMEGKKEFLSTLVKGFESALLGRDEGLKQAAMHVLNTIFPKNMNFADKIVEMRRESVSEPKVSQPVTSSAQRNVEAKSTEQVEVRSTVSSRMAAVAKNMRANIEHMIQNEEEYRLEDLDYEFGVIRFSPHDPDISYTPTDLIDLGNEDSFKDFTAFLSHLSILMKMAPDNSQRIAAESIIEGLGGSLEDFK